MNLSPTSLPKIIFYSLESTFSINIASHFIEKQFEIISLTPLPRNLDPILVPFSTHISPHSLNQLSSYSSYSVILDPYVFDLSTAKNPQELTALIQQIANFTVKTLVITPERYILPNNRIPEWLTNSDQLIQGLSASIQQAQSPNLFLGFTRDQFDEDCNSRLSPIAALLAGINKQQCDFPYQGQEVFFPSYSSDVVSCIPQLLFGHPPANHQLVLSSTEHVISINFLFLLQSIYEQISGNILQTRQLSISKIQARITGSPPQVHPTTFHPINTALFNSVRAKALMGTKSQVQVEPSQIPSQSTISAKKITKPSPQKKPVAILAKLLAATLLFLVIIGILIPPTLVVGVNKYLISNQDIYTTSPSNSRLIMSSNTAFNSSQKLLNLINSIPALEFITGPVSANISQHHTQTTFIYQQAQLNQLLIQLFRQITSSKQSNNPELVFQISALALEQNTLVNQAGSTELLGVQNISLPGLGRLSQILPGFFPVSSEKKILLVIQDDTELRPTGGFVHTLALIHVNRGKITSVDSQSSSELDNLLNGQVTPPSDFVTATDQINWYLRDANWSLDFPTSAKQVSWFYQKETNQKVDAVAFITLSGMQQLLDHQQFELNGIGTIEAQNLKQQLFAQSQSPSAEAGDIIVQILNQYYKNISNLSDEQVLALYQHISEQLQRGDILLYTTDEPVQHLISDSSIAGDNTDASCHSLNPENCISDTLYLNEANIGINQVNQFIDRQHQHTISVGPEFISHSHTLTLTNNSPSLDHPGGTYKVYVRARMPSQSVFEQFLINAKPVSESEIIHTGSKDNVTIGTVIEVGVGEKAEFQIDYQVMHSKNKGELQEYQLTMYHQPGTPAAPIEFLLQGAIEAQKINWGSVQTTDSTLIGQFDRTQQLKVAFQN